MSQKIPATIITGFLGAGKTTLIRHLLETAQGKRIALIVNEFGDIGVDGDLLRGCGDEACRDEDLVELANGCICCTVADDFIPTMQKLIERETPPDHIIIETSGLALPQPLVRAFNWPDIRTRVTVDSVITVIDAAATHAGQFAHDIAAINAQRAADETLDHETPLSELFEDQLACADMLIVNKADLLDEAALQSVCDDLEQQTRAGVQIIRAQKGQISAEVLLGLDINAESDLEARHELHHHHHDAHDDHHDDDHDHHHDHHHDHDSFESFIVAGSAISDLEVFKTQLIACLEKHQILRLKGFAQVAGKPMRLVIQAVGPRLEAYFDRPLTESEKGHTRLVVIGLSGMNKAAIETDLALPQITN